MLQVILEAMWFFVPAMVANMAPVFFARYKLIEPLNIPIDGGAEFNGVTLLGDHKTIRGFLAGLTFGSIAAFIQYLLFEYQFVQEISLINYSSASFSVGLGLLLGFGALFGDSVKSFIKRQLRINPGHSWPVFDQVDYVLGAIFITWWLVNLSYFHIIISVVILGLASYIVSVIGVITRLKNDV